MILQKTGSAEQRLEADLRPKALGDRPRALLRKQYPPGLVILPSKGFLSSCLMLLGTGPFLLREGMAPVS